MARALDRDLGSLSLLGGVICWEVAGWLFGFPWLPPLSAVIGKLVELIQGGFILGNLVDSLKSLGIGFSIALVGGLVVGGLMGRFKYIDQALRDYVYALFVSPMMIFIPIFFAIFGLGNGTRIAVVVVYAVFVIIIDTAAAIREVDHSLIEMARSYGAKERQIFFRIVLPGALPLVFAGVQLGMGRAVKGMINGEMFIALVGLGAVSQRFSGRFEAEGAFAVALVVLVVAIVLNRFVRVIDRRLTSWTD